jgi:protease I
MVKRTSKVAILVEDEYEDLELWYPYYRLKEAGFEPMLIGPGTKKVYKRWTRRASSL